jgi:hypothetical protein
MERPSRSAKRSANLAGGGTKVSRIRRDPPPPPPKKVTPGELREREAKVIIVGLIAAALAVSLILYQVSIWAGWSPSDTVIQIHTAD